MKTRAIIFSKNRPLQLKSLLLSLRHFSDFPEENMTILYLNDKEISYATLIDEFGCNFIKETAFLKNVKDIVSQTDCKYIQFMVDDLIFRHKFSLGRIENFMDKNTYIDAFCLRMGKNIQNPPNPSFKVYENDILVWDTSKKLGKYWNYFWELGSSFYRKELVEQYLNKCRPEKETFPNPFEYHYYSCMPSTNNSGLVGLINSIRFLFGKKSKRIACFSRSRCLTQGVNLVADISKNKNTEHFTINELQKKLSEGYIVDYRSLMEMNLTTPQPGHFYFKLVKEEELKSALPDKNNRESIV